MSRRILLSLLLILIILEAPSVQGDEDRPTKVRRDKEDLDDDTTWIYNDLPRAQADAKSTGKPLMVVLRCIPCEACSKFDKQLLADDNEVRDLLDDFVCVRIVQANGLDLSLFQFDYDQSFHAFFMNPDRTVYGRFGTRSARPEHEDMTMVGLRAAMLGALELHNGYPTNKQSLAGKQARAVDVRVPEELPGLKGKYTSKLDYEGAVVQSCIHCHQIRDQEREIYRAKLEPMPAVVLFPYPLPDVLGLRLSPDEPVRVTSVEANSLAARAGLRAGDDIESLDGQPLLSTADLQWVLHHAPEQGDLAATVIRDRKTSQVTIPLARDWRRRSDISWRATTWDLRRMATGGLLLEELSNEQRRARGLPEDTLALRVKHAGEYGAHAAAKNAGFRKDDVLVAVRDDSQRQTESQFIEAALALKPGTKTPVKVLRGSQTIELELPTQ